MLLRHHPGTQAAAMHGRPAPGNISCVQVPGMHGARMHGWLLWSYSVQVLAPQWSCSPPAPHALNPDACLSPPSPSCSGQHRPALIVPTCSAAHGSAPVPLNIPAGGCLLSAQQLEVCQCLRLPPDTVMALRRNIYVVDEAVVRNFQVQAAVHYAQQPYGDNYTGTAALWTCRHETSGYEVMACHLPAHLCAKDATELYAAVRHPHPVTACQLHLWLLLTPSLPSCLLLSPLPTAYPFPVMDRSRPGQLR